MWCEVVHNKSILHGLFLVLGISLFHVLILPFVYIVEQSGFPPHYSHIVSVINQPKQWDWTEQTKSKMSDLMNSSLKMFYRYCDNIVLLNFLCSSNCVLNVWYCISPSWDINWNSRADFYIWLFHTGSMGPIHFCKDWFFRTEAMSRAVWVTGYSGYKYVWA